VLSRERLQPPLFPPGPSSSKATPSTRRAGRDRLRLPIRSFISSAPHPNPATAAQFQAVDLTSIRAAVQAATAAGARHFVCMSVAHPAPVMHAFIEVRKQGEALVRASGLAATVLRPWYVLGPGHRWAHLLQPLYAIARLIPSMREGAERLALVPRAAVIDALVRSIESPPDGVKVIEAPAIRRS
jgi:uncharacterized protein YbjT (DUF2867 family)